MNLVHDLPPIKPNLPRVTDPADLTVLTAPDCPAAIWSRQHSETLSVWLDRLPASQLPRWRETVAVEEVSDAVRDACAEAGTPEGVERDELITEIQMLADTFAALMKVAAVLLRLDVITSNACKRFHIDAVSARLICTFRGTGTQLVAAESAGDPGAVLTVSRGSPILLKGTLWPDAPASGLLHRSPPIEGTGETRLVLVFDPVFD
ncbi:MAG: DUF1826 domain-containing protein [Pseudomonadota bacterium]|nr:DUF1826 domain-containing protein [Pseudomonadota bacterium]MEC8711302.1 DUF1826 domain-containing protein [Pseudomonadota bacterium]